MNAIAYTVNFYSFSLYPVSGTHFKGLWGRDDERVSFIPPSGGTESLKQSWIPPGKLFGGVVNEFVTSTPPDRGTGSP